MSFPRYVYQQDAQPTDATPVTIYVYNGTSWLSLTSDTSYIADVISQMGLNILINSVAATATLNDYDELFVDNFTDADGTSNTIDTGNTTAGFSSLSYANYAALVTEAHGLAIENSGATTNYYGVKITTHAADVSLISVTKHASCTATKVSLFENDGTPVSSATFSGEVATFATAETLTASTSYRLEFHSDGGSYNKQNNESPSYPYNETLLDYVGGSRTSGTEDSSMNNIVSLDARLSGAAADSIIQTKAITIPSGVSGHQLYCKNTLAGTGAITYDFSADGGSTWDTDQPLNAKNDFEATMGTSCIIKINLEGTGAGNTAIAENYGIIIFT